MPFRIQRLPLSRLLAAAWLAASSAAAGAAAESCPTKTAQSSEGLGLPLTVQSSKGLGLLQVQNRQDRMGLSARADDLTFAVFTRIIKEELPYVRSFVDHYARQGVTHFYMLSNKEHDLERVEAYLRSEREGRASFTFIFRDAGADQITKGPMLLRRVEEDYVIALDLDEYWVLPPGMKSFHDLVAASPTVDVFYALWRIVTNDNMTGVVSPPYAGYVGVIGKYMAKRSVLVNLHGLHEAVVNGSVSEQRDAGALVHFWGRSVLDVVAKSVSQVFLDCSKPVNMTTKLAERPAFHSCGEGELGARQSLEQGTITQRMKVFALMAQHPKSELVHVDHDLLGVDEHEEEKMLQDIFNTSMGRSMHFIKSLHANYLRYKGCVEKKVRANRTVLDLYPNMAEQWLETIDCA